MSEEEIENRYRQTKSRFAIPSYARVRDVLVEDEKLAKSLKARVESGEQFEEIIEINTLRSGRKKRECIVYLHCKPSNMVRLGLIML